MTIRPTTAWSPDPKQNGVFQHFSGCLPCAAHDFIAEWRGADIVESRSNLALFKEFLDNVSMQPGLARYRLAGVPLRDMLQISASPCPGIPSPSFYYAAAGLCGLRPALLHQLGIRHQSCMCIPEQKC